MRDTRRGTAVSVMMLLLMTVVLSLSVSGDPVTKPELMDGAYLEWSYSQNNVEGTSSREGTQTASVSTGVFNQEDVYILQGSISGTFSTSQGSGTESGSWRSYYRQSDMSLLQTVKDIDIHLDSQSITSNNRSTESWSVPYFRWMKFPLDVGDTWSHEIDRTLTWVISYEGDEISSGASTGTEKYRWGCSKEESVTVEAGSFDCHLIKEWHMESDVSYDKESKYWYNEGLGWWVKYQQTEFYNDDPVVTKEWELISTSGNNPPIAEKVGDVEMEEDATDRSLDLSDIFTDPEGDPLTYGVTDEGDLDVSINGDQVSIKPPENAYGTYRFNLTAKDPSHDPVKAPVKVIVAPVDDPLEIYDGDVSPSSGQTGTLFKFSVSVRDVDGDDPGIVSVIIDGSSRSMTLASGSLENGALYEYSATLGAGDHQHHFEAGSKRLPSSGEIDGPDVSTPAEPTLTDPYLDIEEGGTDTLFSFEVTWTDARGREPDDVFLVVDEGDYYQMISDDTDPEDGMVYYVSTFLQEGTHMHHFEAQIGEDLISFPVNGEFQGPDVFDPEISSSGLKDDGIEDDGSAEFFLTIKYGLGDTPDDVRLLIDGKEYSMSNEGGDIRTGMNLSKKMDLEPGTHRYSFKVVFGDTELITMEKQLTVKEGSANDDDDDAVDINDDGGLDPVIIAVILLVVIIAGIIGYLFYSKRKASSEADEESWDDDV